MAAIGDELPVAELQALLQDAPDDKVAVLTSLPIKKVQTIFLVSWFLGGFGVDRFMLGQTGMGVVKLLTGGGCVVLALLDCINHSKNAKQYNLALVQEALAK